MPPVPQPSSAAPRQTPPTTCLHSWPKWVWLSSQAEQASPHQQQHQQLRLLLLPMVMQSPWTQTEQQPQQQLRKKRQQQLQQQVKVARRRTLRTWAVASLRRRCRRPTVCGQRRSRRWWGRDTQSSHQAGSRWAALACTRLWGLAACITADMYWLERDTWDNLLAAGW